MYAHINHCILSHSIEEASLWVDLICLVFCSKMWAGKCWQASRQSITVYIVEFLAIRILENINLLRWTFIA